MQTRRQSSQECWGEFSNLDVDVQKWLKTACQSVKIFTERPCLNAHLQQCLNKVMSELQNSNVGDDDSRHVVMSASDETNWSDRLLQLDIE